MLCIVQLANKLDEISNEFEERFSVNNRWR